MRTLGDRRPRQVECVQGRVGDDIFRRQCCWYHPITNIGLACLLMGRRAPFFGVPSQCDGTRAVASVEDRPVAL